MHRWASVLRNGAKTRRAIWEKRKETCAKPLLSSRDINRKRFAETLAFRAGAGTLPIARGLALPRAGSLAYSIKLTLALPWGSLQMGTVTIVLPLIVLFAIGAFSYYVIQA
jgi:hypothetical protein